MLTFTQMLLQLDRNPHTCFSSAIVADWVFSLLAQMGAADEDDLSFHAEASKAIQRAKALITRNTECGDDWTVEEVRDIVTALHDRHHPTTPISSVTLGILFENLCASQEPNNPQARFREKLKDYHSGYRKHLSPIEAP